MVVDINNIDSNLAALQNYSDDNDTHQQAASNNVILHWSMRQEKMIN